MEIPHESEDLNISGHGMEFKLKGFVNFESFAHEIIKIITDRIIKEGAKGIGHIKLYMKGRSGFIKADTIGLKYGIHIEGFIPTSEELVTVTINVIVSGIERERIAKIVNESILELMKMHGLTIIMNK